MKTDDLVDLAEELKDSDFDFIEATKKPVDVKVKHLDNVVWDLVYEQNEHTVKINDYILKACVKDDEKYFEVQTLEDIDDNKLHKASLYDWLIIGVKGEIYACKPDIFEQTYEIL